MLRARLPIIAKFLALILFLSIAALLGTQLFSRLNPNKVIKPNSKPKLDPVVTMEFNDFRYVHYENGHTRHILTAKKDKVFSDAHHELDDVNLELYDDKGAVTGHITSQNCFYIQDKGYLKFEKDVKVDTTDGLKVNTETLIYNQQSQIAESPDKVDFARARVHGNCKGMLLESNIKRLEMKSAVYVVIEPASFVPEQETDKKDTDQKADKEGKKKDKKDQPDDPEKAAKKAARKAARKAAKEAAAKAEGTTIAKADKPNKQKNKAGKIDKSDEVAKANKKDDKAEAQTGLTSDFKTDDDPVTVTGNWGEYTGQDHVIKLRGAAKVSEPTRSISADNLTAYLTPTNVITKIEARGNSKLLREKKEMPIEITSPDMNFYFNELGKMEHAEALNGAQARTLGDDPTRTISAKDLMVYTVATDLGTEVEHIKAVGDVYVRMEAALPTPQVPNPLKRELRSAEADLYFYPGGKFMKQADARQNVILTTTPSLRNEKAEKHTLTADKCKLDFYPENNNARTFWADGNVKSVAEPYDEVLEKAVDSPEKKKRETRTTESDTAQLDFDAVTGDTTKAVQKGNFRYQEGPRHAVSDRANYDAAQKLITLREGKVMVWDDIARTQADEIDLYTERKESFARGKVRTTYYNPATTGNAAPFRNMKSPVFITANEAHSFNEKGEAIYTGDARAWQDESFVKSDRLELYKESRKMIATGSVSSALYQNRTPDKKSVPVFATSEKLNYSDMDRLAVYDGKVKMRQGNDSLDAEQVKIFLLADTNEVKRMEAYDKVVLHQPGRRGEGDTAEYTSEDQRTVLVGNLAKVVSEVQGTVTGRRLTLLSGDDRILAEDQQGIRRVRSTHVVQK